MDTSVLSCVRPSTPTLLLAVLLAACGSEAATAGDAAVRELDDADFPIAIEAGPMFTLGGFEAEGWEQFGRVNTVGFDGAGNLYILDAQAMRVTVVDSAGAEVRSFGRPGNGPGEFGSPLGMAVFPDGRVVVSDVGNRGFVIFGPGGNFDRLVPFQDLNFASGIIPLPSGDVLQVGQGIRISMRAPGGAPPAPPTSRPVQVFSLDTGEPTTVYNAWLLPPPAAQGGPSTTLSGAGGQRINLPGLAPLRAFEPGLHVRPLPDGRIVVADSSSYRLRLLRDGAVEGELARPVAPQAVTPALRERERERRLADIEEGRSLARIVVQGGPGGAGAGPIDASEMERTRIAEMLFAEEIPAIVALGTDPTGRIWVERSGSQPGERGPIDVITPEGGYLGTLDPETFRLPTAFGPDGLVAYVTRDEYDAEVVEVRRLPGEWRGEGGEGGG